MGKVCAKAIWAIACCAAATSLTEAHEHKAPHKGALIVLGDEFAHLELVLDGKAGKLTAYVLDGEAERFVRIQQKQIGLRLSLEDKEGKKEVVVSLKAVPSLLTGEVEGNTSQFEGEAAALKDVKRFSGVVAALAVKGSEFKDVQFRYPEGNEGNH